ncbi:hypothetical protein R5R35_008853 [Gryllus longicercus]|uniref:C2H2-type domain-containing protein n=1 Tax=Gryllus longicercus TaxID=2509291 RepID=A0AAN9YYF9_9ORTH
MAKSNKKEHIFGPLKFPDTSSKTTLETFAFNGDCMTCCILCDSSFMLPEQKDSLLMHMFKTHKFVIADVDNIACLKSYADYWRTRFAEKPLPYFCTTMLCDTDNGSGAKEEYFLLSDIVPEDKLLREGLQKKRLEWILDVQAKERETPISRSCIMCRLHFEGRRADYFTHLHEKHNLHLGSPENLVFTDKLLDAVENMMEKLQCIFCEGYFKERNILKEHMRKKQHKRINPNNKSYDRFYVVNYLEMGKNWQEVQDERDEPDVLDDRTDWSDWEEENVEPKIVCLFCDEGRSNFEDTLDHMSQSHGFQYKDICSSYNLNFYQQIKLVNYIRLQMYNLKCSYCDKAFGIKKELLVHMTEENHYKIPESAVWDQPEYYFPTYENDSFLCHLDDTQDEGNNLLDADLLPDLRCV